MSTFALENEDLCQALRRRVKHYKREHPALSSQQIAKKFNMSSSTLNRIENQDIKNPTIDQVLKVLRGTGETNDLLGFIEEYYPDIADTYKRVYSENLGTEFTDISVETYLTNPDYFLILVLALSKKGISSEFVRSEFGNGGLRKLDHLMKLGLISPDKEGTFKSKVNHKLSQESSKTLFQMTVEKCYRPERIEDGENYLTLRTESLDKKKAIPELLKILKKAQTEINEVFNNPDYFGSDHVFLGLAMDYLVQPSVQERGQNV
tara:strand:- start:2061 stop:2849 length:789 start_codon:yes stop_codon:yes gene_type:complete